LRLRRRPPTSGSFVLSSFASFEEKNDNHEFDFGGVTGSDGDDLTGG
jgi:hypothetical protein